MSVFFGIGNGLGGNSTSLFGTDPVWNRTALFDDGKLDASLDGFEGLVLDTVAVQGVTATGGMFPDGFRVLH